MYIYVHIYRIYIHIILRWIVNRKASCPNKQPNILPCPTLVALLAPATSSKLIRLHTLYFTSHLEDRASWIHHPSEACWRQLIKKNRPLYVPHLFPLQPSPRWPLSQRPDIPTCFPGINSKDPWVPKCNKASACRVCKMGRPPRPSNLVGKCMGTAVLDPGWSDAPSSWFQELLVWNIDH